MATVKLNAGGKVLTKGGKVSCGCCGVIPPAGCCMYPAQALADGYYSENDLPDELTIIACGVPGTTGTVQSSLTRSGSSYLGSPYNTSIRLIVDPEGIASWLVGVEDELLTTDPSCLVTILQSQAGQVNCQSGTANIQVADPFADTYNWLSDDPFTGDPYNPVSTTVTRVSLCRWEGPLLPFVEGTIFCKPVLYLYKGLNDVPNEYGFVWRMQWEGDAAETGGDKIGFNNTPVGEYDADPTPGTWVIS